MVATAAVVQEPTLLTAPLAQLTQEAVAVVVVFIKEETVALEVQVL
jgi:hypothetical protein